MRKTRFSNRYDYFTKTCRYVWKTWATIQQKMMKIQTLFQPHIHIIPSFFPTLTVFIYPLKQIDMLDGLMTRVHNTPLLGFNFGKCLICIRSLKHIFINHCNVINRRTNCNIHCLNRSITENSQSHWVVVD